MTDMTEPPIDFLSSKVGEEMNFISFSDLVKELTGIPFETVYKDYIIDGDFNV